jgi:hypothetical protein
MTEWRFERYYEAYLAMAKEARDRPAAPGDGCGGIDLDEEELGDSAELHREAQKFASDFVTQDDAMQYRIGCPDGRGNRAFCFVIQAADLLCSPEPVFAMKLLKLALAEIAREYHLEEPELSRGAATRV